MTNRHDLTAIEPDQQTHSPGESIDPDEADELGPYDEELPGPPHPINWNLLRAADAQAEWLALNSWVDWLRATYGLPASVVPPFWHRHPELVWELSALHTHWLCAYDAEQDGSAPIGWHHDFAEARERLRDWVAVCGTRLSEDRPTRQTIWPGEDTPPEPEATHTEHRDLDFAEYVNADVARRQQIEDDFYATLHTDTGDVADTGGRS